VERNNLYAVFGIPILHSKSPQLFNSAFMELGAENYYTRIRPQSAADIVDIIKDIPLAGANITAPFKEDIIPFLDEVSFDVNMICAVNTVVNNQGKLKGYNTDHHGVIKSLSEKGVNLVETRCLVLGGGGAARSAVFGLTMQGAEVFVCNRTLSKAKDIAADFGCELMAWDTFDTSIHFNVIVSTLLPDVSPPFIESLKFNYLLDASYKHSKVKQIAQKKGAEIIKGERWLLHQATEAYKLFFNEYPPIASMEKGFNFDLTKDQVKTIIYDCKASFRKHNMNSDLMIFTKGMDDLQIKEIIDEEIGKAFSS